MHKIRAAYWTRPVLDGSQNKAAYFMGWCRVMMPSSMLGMLGFNSRTRQNEEKTDLSYILGSKSPNRLVIGHNGLMNGSSAVVYTFPETQSAVVAFSNGLQAGDAGDFSAQILIQALFDLQLRLDSMPLIRKEAEARRVWYDKELLQLWLKARDVNGLERLYKYYIGEYEGFCGTTTLSVESKENDASEERNFAVTFNHHAGSSCDLKLFKKDVYSFFPATRDSWLSKLMLHGDEYRKIILEFRFSEMETKVDGLDWLCDEGEEPAWFQKGIYRLALERVNFTVMLF
jgi:hypothetical protein